MPLWTPSSPEELDAAQREYVGWALVRGEPVSKQRPRSGANGTVYTPKESRDAEAAVGTQVRHGMKLKAADVGAVYALCLHFYLGKQRARKDVDNLAKLVLDGLNNVLYKDDRQVAQLTTAVFRDALMPHTDVWAWRLLPPLPA